MAWRRQKIEFCMATIMNPSEEAQLGQTIEMFEVITQSQPHDYQSLEILKEAYSKLGREKDVVGTSKRIAQAYVQMGQLSSAILEYETILQRFPDDPEVQAALKQIESKATSLPAGTMPSATVPLPRPSSIVTNGQSQRPTMGRTPQLDVDDGRKTMHKIFVDGKIITPGDFDLCWSTPNLSGPPAVGEPFVQILADKA